MRKFLKKLKLLIPLAYIAWWFSVLFEYIAPILNRNSNLFTTTLTEVLIVLLFFLFGLPFLILSALVAGFIILEGGD